MAEGYDDPRSAFQILWRQSKGLHKKGVEDLLIKHCPIIVNTIDLDDGLLLYLFSKKVINGRQKQIIQNCGKGCEQNEKLFDILLKRPKGDILIFLEAIAEENYERGAAKADSRVRGVPKPPPQTAFFKKKLKSFYENEMSELQRMPWVDSDKLPLAEVYVPLSLVQMEGFSEMQKIPLDNYFNMFSLSSTSNKPKRILIQGEPGMGKSTFVQQLTMDWSGMKNEVLNEFELLIALNMSEIDEESSFIKNVFHQLPFWKRGDDEVNKERMDHLESYIDENPDKILVILDGYDEFRNTNPFIKDIIDRHSLEEACVIMTSRPWKTDHLKVKKHTDVLLQIEGFCTLRAIVEYVMKYFRIGNSEDATIKAATKAVMKHLEIQHLTEAARCPMTLLAICILFEENPQNMAGKLTHILQAVEKMLMQRKGNIVDRYTPELQSKLGRLALEGLQNENQLLFFKKDIENDLGSIVFSLGILTSQRLRNKMQENIKVSFYHKLYQELHAAESLKEDEHLAYFLTNLTFVSQVIDFEMVLRFACGMSPRLAQRLLGHIDEIFKKDSFIQNVRSIQSDMGPHGYILEDCNIPMLQYLKESAMVQLSCAAEGEAEIEDHEDYLFLQNMFLSKETAHLFSRFSARKIKPQVLEIQNIDLNSSHCLQIATQIDVTRLTLLVIKSCEQCFDFLKVIEEKYRKTKTIWDFIFRTMTLDTEMLLMTFQMVGLRFLHLFEVSLDTKNAVTTSFLEMSPIEELALVACDREVVDLFLRNLHKFLKLSTLISPRNVIESVLSSEYGKNLEITRLHIQEKVKRGTDNGQSISLNTQALPFIPFLFAVKKLASCETFELTGCLIESGAGVHAITSQKSEEKMEQQEGLSSENVGGAKGKGQIQSYLGEKSMDPKEKGFKLLKLNFKSCKFIEGDCQAVFDAIGTICIPGELKFIETCIPRENLPHMGSMLARLKETWCFHLSRINPPIHGHFNLLVSTIPETAHWPVMTLLSLYKCVSTKKDMVAIVFLLKKMPSLTRFTVDNSSSDTNVYIAEDCIVPLTTQKDIFPKNLCMLSLGGLHIGGYLKLIINQIQNLCKLETIFLNQNKLGDNEVECLLESFGRDGLFPALNVLILRNNNLTKKRENELTEASKKKVNILF